MPPAARRYDTCVEVEERLSEYLDRELTPHDLALVELHLAACPRCAAAARALAETVRAIHRAAGWADDLPACRLR